jgi:hypothetical protein
MNRNPSLHWTTRRLLALGGGFAIALAAACGGSDAPTGTTGGGNPPPAQTPVGNYTISTINAKALPVAVLADTGFTWEVMSGSMSLTADGKYTAVETFRQTVPGNQSTFVDSTRGTWTVAAGTVTFNNTLDQSTFTAAWATTGTLTVSELDGKTANTFVYAIQK